MRKKLCYIVGMVCTIVWLCVSNGFIQRISGSERAQEVTFSDEWKKDIVYWYFDNFISQDNFSEDFSVMGWAFTPTAAANPSRFNSVILRGEDHCYELRTVPPDDEGTYEFRYMRKDIWEFYPEEIYPGSPIGILGDYSTINIKDGYYRVYVRCWENEENYGLADTGVWLQKSGSSMKRYDWRSERDEEKKVTESEPCMGYLDTAEMDGDTLALQGWASVAYLQSAEQKLYVEVKDSNGFSYVYTTNPYDRPDVGAPDLLYLHSGFRARIPAKEIPDGNYTLRILAENSGRTWATVEYELTKFDREIKFQRCE